MPAPDRLDPVVACDLAELDAALAGASDDDGLRAFVDAVRDARPEPGPGFAPRLDHRVAAGFPPAPRRRRSWWAWAPAPAFAATLLVALVVAVAALSGGG